jgi:hypothetical protein
MSSCLVSGWEGNDLGEWLGVLRWHPLSLSISLAGKLGGDGDLGLSLENELFAAGPWQVAIPALGHGRVVCH